MLILHVEDDPNDVFFVRRSFAQVRPDVEITAVRDGEQARTWLQQLVDDAGDRPRPALVLMDLKLPKLTGFEVLAWMRAEPRLGGIPVVILSSSSEPAEIEMAYRLGANAYLSKQPDLSELGRIVQGLVTYAEAVADKGNG